MHILFVAPAKALNTLAEFSRIASGHQVDICDGAVDRAKLERFLSGDVQYDVVHFGQDGAVGVLEYLDGPLDKSELVAMLKSQRSLRFIVLNACNSISTGVDIHNAMQLPVIAMNAPITDTSAIRFAEALYRNIKTGSDLHSAVEAARTVLARFYPDQASIPQLINGNERGDLNSTLHKLNLNYEAVKLEIVEFNKRLFAVETAQRSLDQYATLTRVGWHTWAIMVICLITSVLAFLVLVRLGNAG